MEIAVYSLIGAVVLYIVLRLVLWYVFPHET